MKKHSLPEILATTAVAGLVVGCGGGDDSEALAEAAWIEFDVDGDDDGMVSRQEWRLAEHYFDVPVL